MKENILCLFFHGKELLKFIAHARMYTHTTVLRVVAETSSCCVPLCLLEPSRSPTGKMGIPSGPGGQRRHRNSAATAPCSRRNAQTTTWDLNKEKH